MSFMGAVWHIMSEDIDMDNPDISHSIMSEDIDMVNPNICHNVSEDIDMVNPNICHNVSEDIDMDNANICHSMSEDVHMDNPNISELKSLRNYMNWTKDMGRHYLFLDKMNELIKNWKGQHPNLLAVFQPQEIECILSDAVKHVFAVQEHDDQAVLRIIRFVYETGYKDKPDFDKEGRRLLHRATPVHQEAKRNSFTRNDVIYELLKIYDRFDVIYADESGFSHFHVACKYGYLDLIEKFLEAGQDPNCLVTKTGDTPLHVALYSQKKEVFELLLRKGADPNITNSEGLTPLHNICQQHYADGNLARKFLQPIYDIGLQLKFVIDAPDTLGQTPLHMAVYRRRKDLVAFLLTVGNDPNLADAEGSTPLHIVCKCIHEDCKLMEMLFKSCDDKHEQLQVNAQDKEGNTPLIWTVQRQHWKLMRYLLRRGADPTLANSAGLTPLRIVCKRRDDETTTILFEHSQDQYKSALVHTRDSLGQLSLNLALDKSYPTLLELLLKHGADPNSACANGLTPLHVIAKSNHLAPMVKKLFVRSSPNYKPPQVDARDTEGNTPLHFALARGNRLSIGYLLSKGANPNLANTSGSTPLHLGCKSFCFVDWADSFFEHSDRMQQRVQLDLRDGEGCTPLHIALISKNNMLAEFLLRRGADATVANAHGVTPLHIICARRWNDRLVEQLFNVIDENQQVLQINCQDREGNTPLHLALDRDNEHLVRLLLIRGADPNIANNDGLTCLHVICGRKNDNDLMKIVAEICDDRSLNLQIDAEDNYGRRPLQMAVEKLWPKTVDILCTRGADLTNFVFPDESTFEKGIESWRRLNNYRLNFASGAMLVMESLMKRGYDLERKDALVILKLFQKYGLIERTADSEAKDSSSEEEKKKKMMIKPDLSLYDLMQLQPEEAAKRLTFWDYHNFSTIDTHSTRLELSWEVHLCDKLSRGFYQWWALDCFWQLIHYRLPLVCAEMIVNNLTSTEDLWNICLSVTEQSSQRP